MRPYLLGLTAVLAISAAPAAAQSLSGAGFTAGSAFHSSGNRSLTGVTVHRGGSNDRDDRRHHRRSRGDGFGVYVGPRDGYDLNRGWAPDSYNDWWHDRPDRAFPRWVGNNQKCERQWWSGSGWRC